MPLLLHRISCTFNSQIKKSPLISILKFNLSGKNVLKDDLIVGKQCVCQMARFLVDSSSRADCCIREQRGNDHKKKFEMELITNTWKPSCGNVSISQCDSNCCLRCEAGIDKTSFAGSGTALE